MSFFNSCDYFRMMFWCQRLCYGSWKFWETVKVSVVKYSCLCVSSLVATALLHNSLCLQSKCLLFWNSYFFFCIFIIPLLGFLGLNILRVSFWKCPKSLGIKILKSTQQNTSVLLLRSWSCVCFYSCFC